MPSADLAGLNCFNWVWQTSGMVTKDGGMGKSTSKFSAYHWAFPNLSYHLLFFALLYGSIKRLHQTLPLCFLAGKKLPLSPTLTGWIKQKANQMMKSKRMKKIPWTIQRRLAGWLEDCIVLAHGLESSLMGMYDCLEEVMKWISSWGWGNCNVWRGRAISVLYNWGLTGTIPVVGGAGFPLR